MDVKGSFRARSFHACVENRGYAFVRSAKVIRARMETLIRARSTDRDACPCAECGRRRSSVRGLCTETLVRVRSADGDTRPCTECGRRRLSVRGVRAETLVLPSCMTDGGTRTFTRMYKRNHPCGHTDVRNCGRVDVRADEHVRTRAIAREHVRRCARGSALTLTRSARREAASRIRRPYITLNFP